MIRNKLAGTAAAAAFAFGALGFYLQLTERVPLPRALCSVSDATIGRYFNQGAGIVQFHPRWFWDLRPGASVLGVDINQDGYRGVWFPKARGARFRIAAIGDSFTLDPENSEETTWVRLLETAMRKLGFEAQIMNFGEPGYTAFQGLEYYKGRVREFSPDLVLAAFGTRYEMQPGDYGRSDVDRAEVTTRATHRLRRWLERNGTFRFLSFAIDPPKSAQRIREENGYTRPRLSPAEFEQCLKELVQVVRDDGHSIVLMTPPRLAAADAVSATGLEYTKAVRSAAAATRADCIDLHAIMAAHQEKLRAPGPLPLGNRYFTDAERLTQLGAEYCALGVYEELARTGWIPAPVKK